MLPASALLTAEGQVEQLQHQLSDQSLQLLPEYENRLRVLERLNYINSEHAVLLKVHALRPAVPRPQSPAPANIGGRHHCVPCQGRVACEVSTCNEILVTELVFNNVFANLEPEEIVALLSAMVFQDRK